MKAYLIDPVACEVSEIDVADNDKDLGADMKRIIGADTLDHQTISDRHDSVWLDDEGLNRGEPIYAFKLPVQDDPHAGKAVVIGADDEGVTRRPTPDLLAALRGDVEWLGPIVPEVVWETTANGERAIVTWSKAPAEDPEAPELGACCGCETLVGVRNIVMLNQRCIVSGHGWGCLQCNLPMDGASAVFCDRCFEAYQGNPVAPHYQGDQSVMRFACRGFPASDGRIPIAELPEGVFDHDPSKHPEVER